MLGTPEGAMERHQKFLQDKLVRNMLAKDARRHESEAGPPRGVDWPELSAMDTAFLSPEEHRYVGQQSENERFRRQVDDPGLIADYPEDWVAGGLGLFQLGRGLTRYALNQAARGRRLDHLRNVVRPQKHAERSARHTHRPYEISQTSNPLTHADRVEMDLPIIQSKFDPQPFRGHRPSWAEGGSASPGRPTTTGSSQAAKDSFLASQKGQIMPQGQVAPLFEWELNMLKGLSGEAKKIYTAATRKFYDMAPMPSQGRLGIQPRIAGGVPYGGNPYAPRYFTAPVHELDSVSKGLLNKYLKSTRNLDESKLQTFIEDLFHQQKQIRGVAPGTSPGMALRSQDLAKRFPDSYIPAATGGEPLDQVKGYLLSLFDKGSPASKSRAWMRHYGPKAGLDDIKIVNPDFPSVDQVRRWGGPSANSIIPAAALMDSMILEE